MTEITLSGLALHALARIAGPPDKRPALAGVSVAVAPGVNVYRACNGLAYVMLREKRAVTGWTGEFIVPCSVIAETRRGDAQLIVQPGPQFILDGSMFAPIPERWPALADLLATDHDPNSADALATLRLIGQDLGAGDVIVYPNGNAADPVTWANSPDLFALLHANTTPSALSDPTRGTRSSRRTERKHARART